MVIYTDPIDYRYRNIFNHQEELETKLKNREQKRRVKRKIPIGLISNTYNGLKTTYHMII